MEQKICSLLQILARTEVEIDKIRLAIVKAASSDFQRIFDLLYPTADAISSFGLAKFLESKKVPVEQDEVRMIITQYDINKKGKWDLETLKAAFTPRTKGLQQSALLDNPKEIEDQLVKFFNKELELIRSTHPVRVQLYEGGGSPISNFYKMLNRENKEDLTLTDLDGFLRRNRANLNDNEKIALISRADKTNKSAISYKEFDTYILPDVTRKKILGGVQESNPPANTEKKPEQTNVSKPPVPKVAKAFADEPNEHLEVTFRDSQSGFNLANSHTKVKTDNMIPKEFSAPQRPLSSSAVPDRNSERIPVEVTRSTVIGDHRADPRYHQSPTFGPPFHPQQQPPDFSPHFHPQQNNSPVTIPPLNTSYSSSLLRPDVPPLNEPLQRSSVNSEKEHIPSFFNPHTQSLHPALNQSVDPQKVYLAPNPQLLQSSFRAHESQASFAPTQELMYGSFRAPEYQTFNPVQFPDNLVTSVYVQSPQMPSQNPNPAPETSQILPPDAFLSGPAQNLIPLENSARNAQPLEVSQRPQPSLYVSGNSQAQSQMMTTSNLKVSQKPEAVYTSVNRTPERPQKITMAALKSSGSLLEPFETGSQKFNMYSPAKPTVLNNEVNSAAKKLSLSSHKNNESISSNYSLQRPGTPKTIKAKELLGSVYSFAEVKSPTHERNLSSPTTYQPKIGTAPFLRMPSSTAQSPDRVRAEETASPPKFQKAMELFASPQRTPKYLKFKEMGSSLYNFQSASNGSNYGY